MHTSAYNAGIEPVWYSQEKQNLMLTRIKLVQDTHCFLQCWYTTSLVFRSEQLRRSETVEVGCPRHPGATTIGNQLQDGDRTDGWPNLTTQP